MYIYTYISDINVVDKKKKLCFLVTTSVRSYTRFSGGCFRYLGFEYRGHIYNVFNKKPPQFHELYCCTCICTHMLLLHRIATIPSSHPKRNTCPVGKTNLIVYLSVSGHHNMTNTLILGGHPSTSLRAASAVGAWKSIFLSVFIFLELMA